MKALLWFLRGILFVILLGLAIKNSSDVELRFFFDAHWQVPLSIVVLLSMVTGVVLGLLALLPQLFRQRRNIAKLQRQANQMANAGGQAAAVAEPNRAIG
jgi:putative membrane protein